MSSPLVISVILNTNRREDTLAALDSLSKNDYPNHKVIVLDNASQDGSISAILSAYPHVHIIELGENHGYAGNNNVGIQEAIQMGAGWIFVLNEDTILASDCLSRLVAVGEGDQKIGIVGPMVYHHSEPEVIQSAGGTLAAGWQARHRGQNDPDKGQYPEPQDVDWVSGCAIMVRSEMIAQVGPLDARFFYYYEETEWCLRARSVGWRVVQVPKAKLWHKGVQRDYRPGPNVTYYATRNRFLMLAKHRAPTIDWLAAWIQILRTLASWTVKPRWRVMRLHRDAMWQGTLDFLRRRWGMRPI